MLDYAANGTAFWQAGTIAATFAETAISMGRDPEEMLERFVADGTDPEEFWEQVDANFAAGRLRMLFVADQIPAELTRIVEFLNEQMRAEVHAVELRWFSSDGGITALSPRTIGQSERARLSKGKRTTKPKIEVSEWVDEAGLDPHARELAPRFVAEMEAIKSVPAVTLSHAAINFALDASSTKYPLSLRKDGGGTISIHFDRLISTETYKREAPRQSLYDQIVEIIGPLSTRNIQGIPGFPLTVLINETVLDNFIALIREVYQKLREAG